jgi:hypothetical protein
MSRSASSILTAKCNEIDDFRRILTCARKRIEKQLADLSDKENKKRIEVRTSDCFVV